jgi:hypothetical protein
MYYVASQGARQVGGTTARFTSSTTCANLYQRTHIKRYDHRFAATCDLSSQTFLSRLPTSPPQIQILIIIRNADDRTFYLADPAAYRHRGPHNRRFRPFYPSSNRWHFEQFPQAIWNIDCTVVSTHLTYKTWE